MPNQVPTIQAKLNYLRVIQVAVGSSIVAIAASLLGIFQIPELLLWDRYVIWRPYEVPDPNIVVVTIDEDDAIAAGSWPISDLQLAQLLNKINAQDPSVIGMNLFRNLAIGTGAAELEVAFGTMPHLIGTAKLVGAKVAAPEILEAREQIGFSDIVVDPDGVVRRALVSIQREGESEAAPSFATAVALKYLEQQDILIEVNPPKTGWYWLERLTDKEYFRWGKVRFRQLSSSDGGYVRVDSGGFQLLFNYRGGGPQNFATISMQDLLADRIPPELVENVTQPPLKDRIVLIGTTNDSDATRLLTPYSSSADVRGKSIPGVFIQAHLVSQFVQGAMQGRPFLKVVPKQGEWVWVLIWAIAGAGGRWMMLNVRGFSQRRMTVQNALLLGYISLGVFATITLSYSAFLLGWWLPAVPALGGFVAAALVMGSYHNYDLQRLATLDGLTQVANRRYFEEYLYQAWWKCERDSKPLALIMCDIDHFKLYNDHYGHQVGDRCLKQVVESIQQSLRDSDLVARYGGEEFIVVLPNTNQTGAYHVAERICQTVVALGIEHQASLTADTVTVSCGVSSVKAHSQLSPVELIASADQALYLAKAEGRNQAHYQPYQNLPPLS